MRNIDFLPESYRQGRRLHTVRVRRLWLAGIGLAVLACWFGLDELRVRRMHSHVEYLSQQNQMALAGLEQITKLQAEQAALLDRHRLLQELQSPASSAGTVFQIAEMLPENVSLKQLQMTCRPAVETARAGGESAAKVVAEGGRATQAVPDTVPRVSLTGIAPSQVDIAVLLGHLSACREFANVQLEYCKAADVEGRHVQEFRVTLEVVGATDGRSRRSAEQGHGGAAVDEAPAAGVAASGA